MASNGQIWQAIVAVQKASPDLFEALKKHGVELLGPESLRSPVSAEARLVKAALQLVADPDSSTGQLEIKARLQRFLKTREDPSPGQTPTNNPPNPHYFAASAEYKKYEPNPTPPASARQVKPGATSTLTSPAVSPPPVPPAAVEWQEREPEGLWLPPSLDQRLTPLLAGFAYANELTVCDRVLGGWRVLAGTRRGRLHAHHATHREDAFFHAGDPERKRFWVLCVCDGAGSSRLSRIGSEVTCRTLVTSLSRLFQRQALSWEELSMEDLQAELKIAVSAAVQDNVALLGELAQMSGSEPKDFRCTLLLTILYRHAGKELVCLSQVGDGFLAGLNRQGTAKRYHGEVNGSGEFSGEVKCFVPDDRCAELARPFGIIPSTENLTALLLSTDGIEDPFYPIDTHVGALFQQITSDQPPRNLPVGLSWPAAPDGMLACPDPDLARQRMARWLAFEKKGENDDRTMMILHRDPLPPGA